MVYEIKFSNQTRENMPDTESYTIRLTKEQYLKLPELSIGNMGNKCQFYKEDFPEQIRNPKKTFPALWLCNPGWRLKEPENYLNPEVKLVFVCLDMKNDIWIAFPYFDLATVEDAYGSTVSVSCPAHAEVYRLDDEFIRFVKRFF